MEMENYCVHEERKDSSILYFYAPYSSLIDREEDRSAFYRRMRMSPFEIELLLAEETERVTGRINGVSHGVISIADPYANPRIIGEKNVTRFAETYLYSLLRNIRESGRTIYLCPQSSVLMEKHGFLQCSENCMERQDYRSFLNSFRHNFSGGEQLNIFGHQCINTGMTDKYYTLSLTALTALTAVTGGVL